MQNSKQTGLGLSFRGSGVLADERSEFVGCGWGPGIQTVKPSKRHMLGGAFHAQSAETPTQGITQKAWIPGPRVQEAFHRSI